MGPREVRKMANTENNKSGAPNIRAKMLITMSNTLFCIASRCSLFEIYPNSLKNWLRFLPLMETFYPKIKPFLGPSSQSDSSDIRAIYFSELREIVKKIIGMIGRSATFRYHSPFLNYEGLHSRLHQSSTTPCFYRPIS
jgi:hypothetical protein